MFVLVSFCALLPVLSSRVSSLQVMPHNRHDRYVELGGDLLLECNYELGEDSLHSIKWYRDDNEFYRYRPTEKLPRIYQLGGLLVDNLSSPTHLRVRNVSFETSGRFRCEVTGGPPGYQTAALNTQVLVVDLPDSGPKITGVKSKYHPGDEVDASCSSTYSQPAPTIKWWINDNAAGTDKIRTVDEGYTTQLRFKIKTKDLVNDSLRLKCTVELLNLYWKSSEVEAQMSRSPGYSMQVFPTKFFTSQAVGPRICPVFLMMLVVGAFFMQ